MLDKTPNEIVYGEVYGLYKQNIFHRNHKFNK